MNAPPLKPPEPFITPQQGEKLVALISDWRPHTDSDAEYQSGFREAQRIACTIIMSACGGDSGCAPVASPNGFHPEK